jgi:hypothetical protein
MAYIRRQAADWAALIDQWRQSGLSLPAFCRLHGLSRGTMQNWVYKPALKRAVEQARRETQATVADPLLVDGPPPCEPSPAFLPVHVAEVTPASPPTHRTGVEVVLGAGRRVLLEAGFDSETLRRVVAVLEGRPC